LQTPVARYLCRSHWFRAALEVEAMREVDSNEIERRLKQYEITQCARAFIDSIDASDLRYVDLLAARATSENRALFVMHLILKAQRTVKGLRMSRSL